MRQTRFGTALRLRHYLKAVIPTAELKPDQDRLRRVVLDLHTNQVIDNLILAKKECKLLCQRSPAEPRVLGLSAAGNGHPCLLADARRATILASISAETPEKSRFRASHSNARACKPLCARFRNLNYQVPGNSWSGKLSSRNSRGIPGFDTS